jgi:hypothetical protein
MPEAAGNTDSSQSVKHPTKTEVLSEAALIEHIRQHRAKVLTVRGLLLKHNGGYVLARDGGGQWLVDGPPRLYRHVGQRVVLEGTRFGFNGIDVVRFRPENSHGPRDSLGTKLRRWLARLVRTCCV